MSGAAFIPVNEPLLDGNEGRYLAECIESGWISSEGPFVRRFEEQFAQRVGRRHGIAVTNGSAALDAAVVALEIGPGDEVILPTFTIISCAASVVRAGATPVLVDSDPTTWNMNVDQVRDRITERTRAIMAVHLYGQTVDMAPLCKLAADHGVGLIEDAAQAIGQTYDDRPCGGFGDVSVFSFYPNKHITTGEGGMVVTDDDALAERCRSLRNLCFGTGATRFKHEELGWNLRMSNLQAALGVAQLERLDESLERKRRLGRLYEDLLGDVTGLQLPAKKTPHSENCYWVYGVVLSDEIQLDAAEAIQRLTEKRVGARPFFWPMHEQPVLRRMGLFGGDAHPVAERLARRGLYLPSGLALTDEQAERVVTAVREVLS